MENIIYAKYSRERRRRFQISTSILEKEDGEKKVIKRALYKESKPHVYAMLENYGKLKSIYQNTELKISSCKIHDSNSVEFDYINGKNMDQLLTEHIDQDDFEKVRADVQFLWNVLSSDRSLGKFVPSREFCEIFGEPALSENLLASPVSNIDMVFSNIIAGDQYVLTDYEWVFDFMIPISYLFARSLLLHGKFQTLSEAQKEELYAIGGVKPEELPVYHAMEVCFQQYVTGKDELFVLSKLHHFIGNPVYFLKDWGGKESYYHIRLTGLEKENPQKENPQKETELFYQQCPISQINGSLRVSIQNTQCYDELVLYPTDTEAVIGFHKVQGRRRGSDQLEDISFSGHNARLTYDMECHFQEPPRLIIANREYEEIQISFTIYHQHNSLIREDIERRMEIERLLQELQSSNEKYEQCMQKYEQCVQDYQQCRQDYEQCKQELCLYQEKLYRKMLRKIKTVLKK